MSILNTRLNKLENPKKDVCHGLADRLSEARRRIEEEGYTPLTEDEREEFEERTKEKGLSGRLARARLRIDDSRKG